MADDDGCFPILSLKDSVNEDVFNEIEKYFTLKFGSAPFFYARVPGRVNLIGEHIDYCGFSVLPMAIEKDIVLAIGFNDTDKINLYNYDSDKYEDFSSSVNDLHIDKSNPKWYHYVICGYKGLSDKFILEHKGFDIVVKGTIPPSAGLSSSSALVCASALAVTYANRIPISKMEMANLCAGAERYIGTQGGGMDQAIGFLAEQGTAKLINFHPLEATNVPLPKGVVFVVCNSCVEMNKAASSQFNIRVIECSLAAKIIAMMHDFEWPCFDKLSSIPILIQKSFDYMANIVVDTCLELDCYKREDVCTILDITDEELCSYLSENTKDLQEFKLKQRAKHVYQEAARVQQFKLICETNPDNAIQELGALMNASHESCRDLYECSHPDLDELVSIALGAGAVGSRLTGAGWGGCCVSLVMENKIDEFMNIVRTEYYEKKFEMYNQDDIKNAMFITHPGSGAAIYET